MANEKKFSIGEAIGFGWSIFKNNAGTLIVAVLILVGIGAFFGYLDNLLIDANPNWATLIDVVSVIINTIIQIGVLKITLDLVFGRQTSLENLFTNWRFFIRYLLASILYTLIVVAGLVLLVFPGVIWAIKFGFYGYNIIEKDMGIVESLTESSKMTMGYKGQLFWFRIVLGLIVLAGFIAIGLGFFIAYPIVLVAGAYAYKELALN